MARLPMPPNPVEVEILSEQASSLGGAGRRAEDAVARLVAAEEQGTPAPEVVEAAVRAVWAWFVQREACGLRDHRRVVAEMGIPRRVLLRLGTPMPQGRRRR